MREPVRSAILGAVAAAGAGLVAAGIASSMILVSAAGGLLLGQVTAVLAARRAGRRPDHR